MAALYWRVKGQGKKAIDCLRQALHYAPHHMKVCMHVPTTQMKQRLACHYEAFTDDS